MKCPTCRSDNPEVRLNDPEMVALEKLGAVVPLRCHDPFHNKAY